MIKKNKQERKTLASPLTFFHMEATRTSKGVSLMVSGIIGIKDFTDSYIILVSHAGRITISGNKMLVNVYDGSCVEIIGKIEEIGFSYVGI